MKKGFTLIELMIVVAIIAIIAAIAIPNLMASKLSANEGAAASNLKAYLTAQEQYRTNNYSFTNAGAGATAADQKLYAEQHAFLGGSAPVHVDGAGNSLKLLTQPVADAVAAASAYNGYFYNDMEQNSGAAVNLKFQHGLNAVPAVYAQTGTNQFIISHEGTVYMQDTGNNTPVDDFVADPVAGGWMAQ